MANYKEMQGMPPPYTPGPAAGGGYAPGAPGPMPMAGYAPAPPVFQQQQSSNTNVVVVGQPSAPPPTVVHRTRRRENDYLVFTLVLLILCFLHGNILALLLLVPALICSVTASSHNSAGEYERAHECGQLALCCNICVIIKYVLMLVAAVIVVILFFTGVLVFASTATSCYEDCTRTDIYGYTNCQTVCY